MFTTSKSTMTTRRIFLLTVSAGAAGLGLGAQAQTKVDEKDPQAVALGYVAEATKTDAKKYPNYAKGQMCSNCALYQGKPADAAGGCPLFAGKQVASKGWCSAWAKKG
jgi:anaerobic selenocysteine-containing dehydrogenase